MTEMERELPTESSNVQGDWKALLSEETQKIIDRVSKLDTLQNDIGNFINSKQMAGAADQHDIGWFEK